MPDDGAEATLVRRWREGDPDAVRQVVATHGPALLRVALSLCPRVEDAEEVVQDAFLQAHRSLASFDPRRGALRAWLVGVTANRARQVRRGLGRYLRLLARIASELYVAPSAGTPERGDLALARRRLALLTPREREAFVLVELEELSSAESARIMGISDSTVRVLVTRARSRLERERTIAPAPPIQIEGRRR